MTLTRNVATEDGRRLGACLSRWADQSSPEYAADFAARGMPIPQRCRTCAFRAGTMPNGSPTTTMDALKCVMEFVDFRCHEKDAITPDGPQVCVGWAMLVTESVERDGKPMKCPWSFSDEPEGSK